MKKIVILKDPSQEDDLLVACLHILFPECEVQIGSNGVESVERGLADPSNTKDRVGEKKDNI